MPSPYVITPTGAPRKLLEKAEEVVFDAVNDETAPIPDRVRAAFYILDTVPPPDWWPGRRPVGYFSWEEVVNADLGKFSTSK